MREYNGQYVTLMLCSKCNNNCKHCYIRYNGRFTDKDLDFLIPRLNEKYKVLLNGTEPILYPEYFKYFKMVNEHRIITNGIEILENPCIMDELLKNDITNIWLSYHFGIQDDISRIKTKDLDILIQLLKSNGFMVKLMCSLSKDNYKGIESYCERAVRLNADKIKFTNFISQGNAHDNYEMQTFLNQEEINVVLSKIDVLREKYPKEMLYIERCGTFGPNYKRDNFQCLAGTDMAVIIPSRKVFDCVFNISDNTEIGYMDEDGKIIIDENKGSNDNSYCRVLRRYNGV